MKSWMEFFGNQWKTFCQW